MKVEKLKIESALIEQYIQNVIDDELRKREIFILDVFLYFVPIFSLYPIIYLSLDLYYGKPVNIFYGRLLIYMVFIMIYHRVCRNCIQKGCNFFVFRFINIGLESITIAVVFFIFYRIFDAVVILSGPIVMVFMVLIIFSGFRLSFKLSVFAGNISASLYLALAFFILNQSKENGIIAKYWTIGYFGVFLKASFLILLGAVCGILAVNAKKMIRNIAIKNYETAHIRNTFGKYVSDEIRDYILNRKTDLEGELNYGVILFANISNFDAILRNTLPQNVVGQLNEYLEETVEIISKHRGIINKFVSSMVMVVFGLGNEIKEENAEVSAVEAAAEMCVELDRLNQRWQEEGKAAFKIGIGIASGIFVTGNIGGKNRKEFTCIGDVVNTASRLQSLAGDEADQRILISEEIEHFLHHIGWEGFFRSIGEISLKGKSCKMNVYEMNIEQFKASLGK